MSDLLYIHWDVDPTIFGLPFRWYGLLFASSFFFGYILMSRIFKKEGLPERWMESITIYMAVGTIVGARFGHCFFYYPEQYLSNPIEILKIWEGGLASHGAAIGIIVALWLWSRRVSKRPVLWSLDRIVIMVALSGLFIRSGNLMNSEIVGKPTTAPWGFVFPREDQGIEMQAKWKQGSPEVKYWLGERQQIPVLNVFRTYDEKNFSELPGIMELDREKRENFLVYPDRSAKDTSYIRYLAVLQREKVQKNITPADSNDRRVAHLIHQLPGGNTTLAGRWEGDKVRLSIDMTQAPRANSRTLYLFRSEQPQEWSLVKAAVFSPSVASFDTTFVEAGNEVSYMVVEKASEVLLVARHPAQIYEALAYSFIFFFLMYMYRRRNGKVPYGQFFGYFLVLVFTARFLIEFMKEGFIEALEGFPLNMGQMLSIPFVLAGFFFIFMASKKGYQEPPPVPPQPEKKSAKKKKDQQV